MNILVGFDLYYRICWSGTGGPISKGMPGPPFGDPYTMNRSIGQYMMTNEYFGVFLPILPDFLDLDRWPTGKGMHGGHYLGIHTL